MKDFGWNELSEPMWYIGLIPTLIMALDFAWTAAKTEV
jgi:hypothetical protein